MNEETDLVLQNKCVFPDSLREAVEAIPQELYQLEEETLKKRVNPTFKHYEVKKRFWKELERCHKLGDIATFVMAKCYKDILPKTSFERFIRNPEKMAWLTSPLIAYEDLTNAALLKATERYEELLSIDIKTIKKRKDDNGDWEEYEDICPKKAKLLLDVIKNLEDRVNGLAVQRQISINTKDEGKDKTYEFNMESVEGKLKELEEQLDGKAGRDQSPRVLPETVDYSELESTTDNGRALPDQEA